MIRPININLNAAHPELPLVEATTFTGAPSSVFIRGVPKAVGNWSITAVSVAVTYPDNTTTARAAVESAEGVWVATIPGTATSGRTAAGFKIMADGIDENGAAVTGYVLGFADFSVLSFTPVPAPGGTFYLLRYFDQAPATPKEGDVAVVDGLLKMYNGTAWVGFGDGPGFSTDDPQMDGTASPGSAATAARSDHVHPSDTSKLDKSGGTVTGPLMIVRSGDNIKIDGSTIRFNDENGNPTGGTIGGTDGGGDVTLPTSSGTIALVSDIPAVVAPSTSASDSGKAADAKATGDALALKANTGDLRYALGALIDISRYSEVISGETVYYGEATLADRTANLVGVAVALDELRVTIPPAVSGKVRDFGLLVAVGADQTALTAPALVPVAPTGETITMMNADGEIPTLADGTTTASGVTVLYFTEVASGVFLVKGEQIQEVA